MDSNVNGYVLSLETYYGGAFVRSGVPVSTFSEASELMEKITDEHAEKLFKSLVGLHDHSSDFATIQGRKDALAEFENWLKIRNAL